MSVSKSPKAGYWMFVALVIATSAPVLIAHFMAPASAAAPAATVSLNN